MSARRIVPLVALCALLFPAGLVNAESYQVRRGDTLSAIATRLGVDVDELAAANGITDPNVIVAGRMLVVPVDGARGTSYVVRSGDTLSGIAGRLGVAIDDLARANGIRNHNHVEAGRLLSVPGATTPGAGRYTVRPGDNLTLIASRLGVSVGDLVAANGIRNPNVVYAGVELVVPGSWRCPVRGATFVNDFGYVKADGSTHDGVDLFAPRGTPVLAPEAGTVTTFPNPKGGLAVHLRTADGTRYYVAHLDAYGATGRVAAGTEIGRVGNSGNAANTSPHAHLEIRPGGGATANPFPTLVAACR